MHPAKTALCSALLCFPLWACVPEGPASVTDGPAPDTAVCGADKLASYIGRPVTSLPTKGPWVTVRVIKPGMGVTMDYSATRLNATVDGVGKVLNLTCG